MTDDEIRIVIAEDQGWKIKQVSVWEKDDDVLIVPPGTPPDLEWSRGTGGLPNWPKDLNACHELEKTIQRFMEYEAQLVSVCKSRTIWNATARQRCEAYLRQVGKWKDAP